MIKPSLLVVDEASCPRRILARTLDRAFSVTCVNDAEAALAAIDGGARFDAILSAVSLGGMSGHELRRELSSRSPSLALRLVLTSSTGPVRLDARRMEAGVRHPIDVISLGEIVGALRKLVSARGSLPPASIALAA